MPTVRGEITENDSRYGRRTSSCACPLALSLNRVLPYGRLVAVGKGFVTVLAITPDPRPASVRIELTPWLRDAVTMYDAGGLMPMVKYELEFPEL